MTAIDLTVVQNDTKPDLNLTIVDSNGIAIDITDFTVRFKFRTCDESNLIFNRICIKSAPLSGSDGKCTLFWALGDLDTVGDHEAEIELTNNLNSGVQTVPRNIYIRVRPEF